MKKWVVFVLFLGVMGLVCSIPFYFESPSMYYKLGMDKVLLRSGKVFGLAALVLILSQPIWAGRFIFLDRIFGHIRLLYCHQLAAVVAIFCVLFHALFVLWADGFGFFPFELRYWPVFTGIGAVVLLSAMIFVSLFRPFLKMRWKIWSLSHRTASLVLTISVLIHVFKVSKPFETGVPFFSLCLLGGIWSILFLRMAISRMGVFSKKFVIVSSKEAAQGSQILEVKPLDGEKLAHLAGQFVYVRVLSKGFSHREHPFTIASAPFCSGPIQFVIRKSGPFTRRIGELKPGHLISIDGPYGRFSHQLLEEKTEMIMIAGGIGITPMLSMLRQMSEQKDTRKLLLFWSNATRSRIIFEKQLSDLKKTLDLDIHHILTRESSHGVYQRIDRPLLETLLNQTDLSCVFFLCGPPEMVSQIKKYLKKQGFSLDRVYTESFVL